MGKLRSVQVLRAAAVLLVVLHHYIGLAAGAAGVDLFFVISGFIMVHVMPGKAPGAFLLARVRRIIPTYYAALLFLFVLHGVLPRPEPLFDSLLLIPREQLYIPQAWTLSFEFVFYAGCALFLLCGRLALLLVPLAWIATGYTDNILVGIVGSPLFLEFLFGVLIAHLPKRHGWVAVGAAAVAFAALSQLQLDRAVQYGVPAALLLYGCLALEKTFESDKWAVPILLGDASYSIYLVHWAPMVLLPASFGLFNAYIATMIGLAFYFAVEKGLVRWSARRASPLGPSAALNPL